MHPKIDFVETSPKNLDGYTLIEGFPGMGLVGTIAAKYVVDRVPFQEMGHLESSLFMPILRIHKGIPVHPSRIYVSEQRKLVVLLSEQVIPKAFSYLLAKAVVEWALKKKIKRVISLEGIRSNAPNSTNTLYGIAANEYSKKKLQENGIEAVEEGITTGVTALILLELKKVQGFEAYSILGNVTISADYQAAGECLKKLNDLLKLGLDIAPLMEEAKKTEQGLVEQIKKVKEEHVISQKFEQDATPMYT